MNSRLEAEAFKKKLLDSMRENQMQDALKSVIRLKVIEKVGVDPAKTAGADKGKTWSLTDKLCMSLLKNYLISKGLTMTVSVLDPETGDYSSLTDLQISEMLSKGKPGLIDFIRGGSGGKSQPSGSSLLQGIIEGFLAGRAERYESSTQTIDSYHDLGLEQKLMMVEEFHVGKVKQDSRSTRLVFEERLRDLEEKYKKDLELNVQRIREVESVKMRAEEAQKYREKGQAERDELERLYNTKLHNLREMERKALETYTDKVRKLEDEYQNKVSSLSRHNDYVEKEVAVRRTELNLEKNEIDTQKIRLNQLEKDLKTKGAELAVKEASFEQRLKNEVDNYKAVTLKEISDKKEQIDIKLAKLNEELNNITEMRRRMDTLADKNLKLETALDDERRVDYYKYREWMLVWRRREWL